MSCGNDGPWKAWKAKTRLPTLSTVLGKPATAAGFPHSHSSDDWSLFKQRLSTAGLTAEPKNRQLGGWAKTNCRSGPKAVAKRNWRPYASAQLRDSSHGSRN